MNYLVKITLKCTKMTFKLIFTPKLAGGLCKDRIRWNQFVGKMYRSIDHFSVIILNFIFIPYQKIRKKSLPLKKLCSLRPSMTQIRNIPESWKFFFSVKFSFKKFLTQVYQKRSYRPYSRSLKVMPKIKKRVRLWQNKSKWSSHRQPASVSNI